MEETSGGAAAALGSSILIQGAGFCLPVGAGVAIPKLKDVMGCCCFLFLPFHSVAQVFVFKIICFLSVRAWDGPCFSHTVCVNDPKEVHAWTSLSHGRALDSPVV